LNFSFPFFFQFFDEGKRFAGFDQLVVIILRIIEILESILIAIFGIE
jgi:hypothetical protein